MVVIFSSKADENLASLVKAVDAVQSKNKNVGAVLVAMSGVEAADLEKLQEKHRLTTPLTIAVQKDGPPRYKLNPDAAVTVLVRKRAGGKVEAFGYTDTKSASAASKKIVSAIEKALN